MKNYINILLFTGLMVVISCDDSVDSDLYGSGSNIAEFANGAENVVMTADGADHIYKINI